MSDSKRKVGWLDLTGHSEVTVLPKKVFNEYASYYTTAGVNLRSGPSTSYGKGPARRPGHKDQGCGEGGQLDLRFRRQQVRLDQLGLSFHQAAGRGDLRQPEPHLRRIGKKRSAMRNAFCVSFCRSRPCRSVSRRTESRRRCICCRVAGDRAGPKRRSAASSACREKVGKSRMPAAAVS